MHVSKRVGQGVGGVASCRSNRLSTGRIEADDLLARALQHEIDHLSGTLIIDKVSKLKRDIVLKKYKKSRK